MIPTCSPYFKLYGGEDIESCGTKSDKGKVPFSVKVATASPSLINAWDYVIVPPEDEPLLNMYTFGWMEDGRLGYIPEGNFMQTSPRPVTALRPPPRPKRISTSSRFRQFVCLGCSSGSRHTLVLMTECRELPGSGNKIHNKVMLLGLNQQGLCEESGCMEPEEVPLHEDEDPIQAIAGYGSSFIITHIGNVYSFGNGRYGVLGHGDCQSIAIPKQIMGLNRKRVLILATGFHHCASICDDQSIFSWGRNHCGQLGLGHENDVYVPTLIEYFAPREVPVDISCGENHTIALFSITTLDGTGQRCVIYGWGDESRGQLGSGDKQYRFRPQENRWLTRFLTNQHMRIIKISAGGNHNLCLTDGSHQIISYGAGDYGQLGHGTLFDDPKPRVINNLKDIIQISAGNRHSACIRKGRTLELLTWGYNGYGELGLGDTDLRVQPTVVTAFGKGILLNISCGLRHSAVVTSPTPLRSRDDFSLRPFFEVLEVDDNRAIRAYLKKLMVKQGLDGDLLDNPNQILSDQPGTHDMVLKNSRYDPGFRYCLDTFPDPADWRRKVYEVCFEASTPSAHLNSVCLSCARQCVFNFRLRPYIRYRQPGDRCDCHGTSYCICSFSRVREQFDKIVGDDGCIGPRQLRKLIQGLRHPVPVDREDIEEAVSSLGDGNGDSDYPRIKPVPFENWYRRFFDEYEDLDLIGKDE